jgi:hypothetical protein
MNGSLARRWAVLVLLGSGALGLAGLTVAPVQAADDAKIYVVQGLPGRTVDVAVDGKTVAEGVKTAAVTKAFPVEAGSRKVTFSDGDDVLLERMFKVSAGSSWDVVLHLPADPGDDADPAVTVFRNDLSDVPRGKAALTVAHTARVGEADVRVDGKVLFADIENGESLDVVVPVATYEVAIVPAGKSSPVVLGPVDLTVQGGALNRVYAIGDPSKKTMNVAVHVIKTGTSGSDQPSRVETGTGGQAERLQRPETALWS